MAFAVPVQIRHATIPAIIVTFLIVIESFTITIVNPYQIRTAISSVIITPQIVVDLITESISDPMFLATIATIKVAVVLVVDQVTLAISYQVILTGAVTFIIPAHSIEVDRITEAVSNFFLYAAVSSVKVAHLDVVLKVTLAISDCIWIGTAV